MGLLRHAVVGVLSSVLPRAAAAHGRRRRSRNAACSADIPCHPSFCGVFHRGPCMPYYLPPIGEDLTADHRLDRRQQTPPRNQAPEQPRATKPATTTAAENERRAERPQLGFDPGDVHHAARLLGAAAEGRGASRHGIHHPLRLQPRRRNHGAAAGDLCQPRRAGRRCATSIVMPSMRRSPAARRCISATAWAAPSPAARSPSASSIIAPSTQAKSLQ